MAYIMRRVHFQKLERKLSTRKTNSAAKTQRKKYWQRKICLLPTVKTVIFYYFTWSVLSFFSKRWVFKSESACAVSRERKRGRTSTREREREEARETRERKKTTTCPKTDNKAKRRKTAKRKRGEHKPHKGRQRRSSAKGSRMKRGRKGSGKNTEGTFSRSFRAALIEIRIPLQILKVKIINDIILCL